MGLEWHPESPNWELIEHGVVPGYEIDGLSTQVLLNLYSQKKSMMDYQRQRAVSQ